MFSLAMLFWVGFKLGAPTWYWWCWGLCAFFTIIGFGIRCAKAGKKM